MSSLLRVTTMLSLEAQLAARRSHNRKVVSSILTCRSYIFPHGEHQKCGRRDNAVNLCNPPAWETRKCITAPMPLLLGRPHDQRSHPLRAPANFETPSHRTVRTPSLDMSPPPIPRTFHSHSPPDATMWFFKQKLIAPKGLPRRSPTLVLTGPCAAELRRSKEIRCIRHGMAVSDY